MELSKESHFKIGLLLGCVLSFGALMYTTRKLATPEEVELIGVTKGHGEWYLDDKGKRFFRWFAPCKGVHYGGTDDKGETEDGSVPSL